MRQFFTLRFWLTLAALGGLALAAVAVARSQESQAAPTPVGEGRTSRRMDLVTWAYTIVPGDGFAMVDGRSTADLAVVLDGTRWRYQSEDTGLPGSTGRSRCFALPRNTRGRRAFTEAPQAGSRRRW